MYRDRVYGLTVDGDRRCFRLDCLRECLISMDLKDLSINEMFFALPEKYEGNRSTIDYDVRFLVNEGFLVIKKTVCRSNSRLKYLYSLSEGVKK